MNIITRVAQSLLKGVSQPFVQTLSNRFNGNGGTALGSIDGLKEYKNWPYACAKVRANSVANTELILKDANGEVVENSPIMELLDRVNPLMTKKDLLRATQTFLDLNGNAFWFLARDNEGKGEVKEIYILRPDRVKIVTDRANPLAVAGYIFKQEGKDIPFAPNEILHFKNFNPNANWPFPHLGVSVIEASQWAIATDNEIRAWNLKFFKNGARPDGILEVSGDGSMGTEEYQRLRAQWDSEHKGSSNAHKTAILSGGVTWKPTTATQTEMEMSGQKELNRDEILAIFQVPKDLLGLTTNSNRATVDASIYIYSLFTVKELVQNIVDTINEFLVADFEGAEKQKLTFPSPVKDDRTEVLAGYTAGYGKWLSRNDIRKLEGLVDTENGDVFMGGFSDVEVDHVPAEKKAKKNEKPATKSKTQNIVEKTVEDFIAKLPAKKEYKHIPSITKANYATVWKSVLANGSDKLKKELRAFFEAQEKEVQANLKKKLNGVRVRHYKNKSADDIAFDMADAVKSSVSLITPFLAEYLKNAGDQATALIGGDSFDPNTSKTEAFIKARAKLFADTINETTHKAVVEAVQEGLDEGMTMEEMSSSVADVYQIAKGSRTDMIARTEASASANEGAKIAYQDAGIDKWEWLVVDPLDEDCKNNEGEVVAIGESFKDGSTQPPDPHPNCECTTLPVYDNND